MSGTGRFMCLSCGRFFSMEHDLKSGETICPFCGDMYFCDNISDIPPSVIGEDFSITGACHHKFKTDFTGDIKFCPVCRTSMGFQIGLKLKDWQYNQIERLRL
jgi:hypothetical protein